MTESILDFVVAGTLDIADLVENVESDPRPRLGFDEESLKLPYPELWLDVAFKWILRECLRRFQRQDDLDLIRSSLERVRDFVQSTNEDLPEKQATVRALINVFDVPGEQMPMSLPVLPTLMMGKFYENDFLDLGFDPLEYAATFCLLYLDEAWRLLGGSGARNSQRLPSRKKLGRVLYLMWEAEFGLREGRQSDLRRVDLKKVIREAQRFQTSRAGKARHLADDRCREHLWKIYEPQRYRSMSHAADELTPRIKEYGRTVGKKFTSDLQANRCIYKWLREYHEIERRLSEETLLRTPSSRL